LVRTKEIDARARHLQAPDYWWDWWPMRAVGGHLYRESQWRFSAVVDRAAGAYCAAFVRQPYFRKITALLRRASGQAGDSGNQPDLPTLWT
jgi:hypothetical protein